MLFIAAVIGLIEKIGKRGKHMTSHLQRMAEIIL